MSSVFQVYVKYGCHLCDEMIEHLNLLKADTDFEIEQIDIIGHQQLEQRYGLKVPVLVKDGVEICHYHLDVAQFKNIINQS